MRVRRDSHRPPARPPPKPSNSRHPRTSRGPPRDLIAPPRRHLTNGHDLIAPSHRTTPGLRSTSSSHRQERRHHARDARRGHSKPTRLFARVMTRSPARKPGCPNARTTKSLNPMRRPGSIASVATPAAAHDAVRPRQSRPSPDEPRSNAQATVIKPWNCSRRAPRRPPISLKGEPPHPATTAARGCHPR